MNQGTSIRIERLFYKSNSRRSSINPSEEFKSILKLMQALAIHHHSKTFTLSSGENSVEFRSTPGTKEFSFNSIAKIKQSEIVRIFKEFPNIKASYEIFATSLGSIKRGKDILIFINDRYVSNESIKKAIEEAYKISLLSIKEEIASYFVYVNLQIRGDFVDVNIHPTKKIVKFLFEAEVTNSLKNDMITNLKPTCAVRTITPGIFNLTSKFKEQPQNTVRTDCKQRTLEGMLLNEDAPTKDLVVEKEFFEQSKLETSEKWTNFVKGIVYVGCLSSNYVLVQNDQTLFLINTIPIALFYFD